MSMPGFLLLFSHCLNVVKDGLVIELTLIPVNLTDHSLEGESEAGSFKRSTCIDPRFTLAGGAPDR